ncbi:Isocitrate dehydrogenase [NADP] [bioreactor metagenome]|uniref:Isocitrate dehydrogenase [NADP] n=1 Tax=bioreactor metagenome TaxID=1076179 RepID=A0A644YXX7_9ZZZZ|nr:isocitrate/isopropylmalate family dehydrogenase [Oscillospiraceae bacterium]
MNILQIEAAKEKFGSLIEKQLRRIEKMNHDGDFINYRMLDKTIIGVCGGDGIGPSITRQAQRILEYLLADEVQKGKIEFRIINGLTIERRIQEMSAIPAEVLDQLKECNVILKGPTTTPRKGDDYPNIESANVAMRKELDLFANVRPVRIPEQKIDWTFYRENTEGGYAAGKDGINVTDDLGIDFTITTTQGCERIIKAAFEFTKQNNKTRITAVTKANIIKTTDGKFLDAFYKIAKEYPGITSDDWYIDIMTAKLVDIKRRADFQVFVLPNLYGDILTDEAAEFQGGVGTAGSANIGKKYAMFEAIHGSAPRMVKEGRDIYADPCSMMRAGAMLLSHIGYNIEAEKLNKALDTCTITEKKLIMTGRDTGATSEEFADYIMDTINTFN